ncbi:MAG: cation-translocating P-type ATPase [bacterium]|nr:cation-translocating P-type ATPase [bacterium]
MEKNEINFLKSIKGLTDEEVIDSREKNGENKLVEQKKQPLILKILSIFKEPMFLLLVIAASIYFIVGEYSDGIIMLIFVFGICTIEYIQETKTDKALEELNKLSSINVKVIRDGKEKTISSEEIVVGDIVLLEEGDSVPADGKILYTQSLGVNESTLTGESQVVYKKCSEDNDNHFKLNMCYSGTNITNGLGVIEITSVGKNTEFGHIGESLNEIKEEKTPLEKQINKLVYVCTIISGIVFVMTIIINYINHSELVFSKRIVESILAGVTIAMATIPEEIPVVLTVFLAMGAMDLTKKKTLTRNMKTIETLGAVNVLCTDKTGTLTENKMEIQEIYSFSDTFLETAYLSCPIVAYDPMEVAIKDYCIKKHNMIKDIVITKEYAFTPETKMTGQIIDNKLLCVKGAYENVLPLCKLDKKEYREIKNKIDDYSKEGYRVLAVAKQNNLKNIPNNLSNSNLTFEGLVALYDPPRKGVNESLKECYSAGVRVIMITGDNGETAKGIAKKIKLENYENVITGNELEKMPDEELFEKVKTVNIFARVYPNHKMRIVNALQKDNKIVAMTGDGVNDAPALKKANIGIAMGKRGTNVAKESADLILLDDNFNTIVKAIENGRNIYKNIRKAISYIIAIHIPIALLSLFVPIFKLPTLLLPIHVMLLELLIDPTSSIVFQRIKPSKDIMKENPRDIKEPILNLKNAIISISQGLLIFLVVFISYFISMHYNTTNLSITIAYSILVLSIMLITYQLKNNDLTLKAFFQSFKDKVSLIINLGVIIGLIIFIYTPFFNNIANTVSIRLEWWIYIILLVLLAVLPFDLFKIIKKRKSINKEINKTKIDCEDPGLDVNTLDS